MPPLPLEYLSCVTTYGYTGTTRDGSACMCGGQLCSTLSDEDFTTMHCNTAAMGTGYISGMTRSSNTNTCSCPAGLTDDKLECIRNDYGTLGIQCSPAQMRNGTCSRNINKTLGIKESNTNANPTLFVQDLVLTATSFVGTLMVIALLVMGFKYVMGGMSESSTGDLKWNMKKLLIGLGLVIGSYTIIRLIQYVARGY